MSDTTKRITLAVRIIVVVEVDADVEDGVIVVNNVVSMRGIPSVAEIMDALDADEDLGQLDCAYAEAGGELPA